VPGLVVDVPSESLEERTDELAADPFLHTSSVTISAPTGNPVRCGYAPIVMNPIGSVAPAHEMLRGESARHARGNHPAM
jgi:hypothetical protein